MLYELLTGTVPFCGVPAVIVSRIAQEPPTPPRRLNPAVCANLEAVVLRCLAKNPSVRYCARQLSGELHRWLDGNQPTLASSARPLRRGTILPMLIAPAASLLGVPLAIWLRPATTLTDSSEQVVHAAMIEHPPVESSHSATIESLVPTRTDVDEGGDSIESIVPSIESLVPTPTDDDEGGESVEAVAEQPDEAANLTTAGDRRMLAASHFERAESLARSGQDRLAVEQYQQSLTLRVSLAADNSNDLDLQEDMAEGSCSLALSLARLGRVTDSRQALASARHALNQLEFHSPGQASRLRNLGLFWNNIGCAEFTLGDIRAARDSFERSRNLLNEAAKAFGKSAVPIDAATLRLMAQSYANCAIAQKAAGDHDAAQQSLQTAGEIRAQLKRIEP
jgi:hypothetical protein